MAEKKKKYKIVHSNYTVKKTHKKLDGNRTIYERDYTVLNGVGVWNGGSIENGTPTFKMVRRDVPNAFKKHEYGSWLTQDACGDNSEIWTINCLKDTTVFDNENKVVVKPGFNSLLDFVYYGSCQELIETSIKRIIESFPAELYFTNEEYKKGFYIVNNDLEIDLLTKRRGLGTDMGYLNIFSDSFGAYEVINEKGEVLGDVISYEVQRLKKCPEEGDLVSNATIEYTNGGSIILHIFKTNEGYTVTSETLYNGYRIRPKYKYIKDVFDKLTDFEKVMLNEYTVPKYTMTLDFPHETDEGIETYKEKFTWPTVNDWNLDVKSSAFNKYVDDLLELSRFYDERCTDNLWRMMTHESIKNMDETFKRGRSNESALDYEMGGTKLRNMLHVYGRLFDYLKRYIDNIKSVNNISYEDSNNIPDYFLSDKLELLGWEVCTTSPSINDSICTSELYSGYHKKYTSTDANVQFMKSLILNSKNILAHKGTRSGIEMLLGLFGLKSYNMDNNEYDYKIDEYVSVVDGVSELPVSGDELLNIERYNSWRQDYNYNNVDSLQGLPVRMVTYTQIGDDGKEKVFKYIIPWFDNLETNGDDDFSPYFQMYGGWCKIPKRSIKNKYAPTINNIVTNDIESVYEETIKYIRVLRNVDELKTISSDARHKDTIFYVVNIEGYQSYYPEINTETLSHYFILKDPKYYFVLGEDYSGWENIPLSDIEKGENDGFKVLYLESIIDEHKGNNPHGGSRYDDGREYLEYFKQLFKYVIANDGFKDIAYDCESGELNSGILNCGFSLKDYVKDNVKTWYFSDTSAINDMYLVKQNEHGVYKSIKDDNGDEVHNEYPSVGKYNDKNFFESEVDPYNFEGGDLNDEASANSLINIKNLTIDFNGKCTEYDGFYDYFIKSILPYLKQVLPSTTIVNIKVKNAIATKENKQTPLNIKGV